MIVEVKLFAAARQLAGRDTLPVDCPDGATVADLRGLLRQQCPALGGLLDATRFAVNACYAAESQVLQAADEVACIPPVSGG
jgi:molybdopterin converting factor subunit 1